MSLLSLCLGPPQSYGADHLLTFSNLRQAGLLAEQPAGEALSAMESKVGKLVNDKTAGETGGGPSGLIPSAYADVWFPVVICSVPFVDR